SSTVYGNFGAFTFGPDGGGAVYRLDGVSGNIDPWMTTGTGVVGTNTLLNSAPAGVTPPGLGDICYDSVFNQFFVSNFADGRIYRVKTVANQGIVQAVNDPFLPYPYSGSPTFAPLGERVWAVHVATIPIFVNRLTQAMKRVLLFSVWLRDNGRQNTPWPASWPLTLLSAANNAIFSWEMDSQGALVAGGPRLYCVMPYLKDGVSLGYSNPVSDITSLGASIYFAERTIGANYGQVGSGHLARVLRLNAFPNKAGVVVITGPPFQWPDPFDYRYRVGDWASPRGWNCAGGVAICRPSQFA